MNKVIIGCFILTCFIVFVGFLTINDKMQFIQNSIQYKNQDNDVAGYKVCVNDYCSGLLRTQEEATNKLETLKKNITPYPENLKYMDFTTVLYGE